MQDNAPNNWKAALEDPNSFPGEIIPGKTEVWEKLHSRLHKKQRNKFIPLYWTTAACLLVIAGSVMLFESKGVHQSRVTATPSLIKSQVPVKTDSLITEPKEKDDAVSAPQQKNHAPFFVNHKSNLTTKTEIVTNNRLSTDSSKQQLLVQTIIPPVLIDSIGKNSVTTAPVKKKLKVVHLNEIGQPVEESMVNNGVTQRHGLELKIIYGEIYNTTSTNSINNSSIFSKSRNISN